MARVTEADVTAIIATHFSDLTPFITAASQLVDRHLTTRGYTSAELAMFERYYAAYLIAEADPRVASETLPDGMQFRYEGASGSQAASPLASNAYGRALLAMETTGTLRRVAQMQPAGLAMLGTRQRGTPLC